MKIGARGFAARWGGVLLSLSVLTAGCGKSDGGASDSGTTTSPSPGTAGGERISEGAQAQIAALIAEKATRPPALHKVDSQLVYALKMQRGEPIAPGIATLESTVAIDEAGFVVVEIDVRDVAPVVRLVGALGGDVIGSYPLFGGVTARVPLTSIEALGAEPAVKFVRQYLPPQLNQGEPEEGVATDVVNSSPGVTVHRAGVAQKAFGAKGQGVQVGVLSDSARYLASVQALGDLPAVTVLPGQAGPLGTGEGTAMLEIVHDMAPSADLYFATAFTGVASFATNILGLRAAGCDVIVDDVFYYSESPFQDGPIAQAVNAVVSDGAVYLSSAGNAGSVLKGTAGVYEGNFVNGGSTVGPLTTTGQVHAFGPGVTSNQVTATSGSGPYTLFWSDPLGASTNDYDLFVLDATLTSVVGSSTNVQGGVQDPFEQPLITPVAGHRLVVVKKLGAQDRYLHLNGNRHRLAVATSGQTKGHSAAAGAFSVAATPAGTPISGASPSGPYPGVFTAANVLETYSSDGARRIFYNANGTLANSGNPSLLADGGVVRQKPDITAADGVDTATPGFGLFYGTSAAAPHAAGIVAQMLSVAPTATGAQIRTALTSTAIDIEGAGTDINSGAGIVMSDSAVSALLSKPALSLGTVTATPTNGSDGVLDPGETATLTLQLHNTSSVSATGVSAVLSSADPSVTVTQASSAYPDIASAGSANNSTAYEIRVASSALCGAALDLTLTVTFAGGQETFGFDVLTGALGATPSTFAYTGAPTPIPNGVGADLPGAPATATITVPAQAAAIGSLTFRIDGTASSTTPGSTTVGLDHTWVGDLALTLTSPSGTSIPLLTRLNNFGGGQVGPNFYNTVLSDSGATSIQAATVPPFTGTFRPVGSLSSFAGEDPAGDWTLTARDYFNGDTGSIRAFSLVVTPRVCTVFDNQGTVCTQDSECSTGQCVDGVCCDQPCGGNNPNDCQACSALGVCGAAPASTVCRAAASECDQEETCGGASACPADAAKTAGTTCGAAPSGACDLQDQCSGGVGAEATCVPTYVSAGTSCRAAAALCDVEETCTGSSPDCPNDVLASAGAPCRPSQGVCDVAEACDGLSAQCPADGHVAAGTECRVSAGDCDVAEACDGSSNGCPADVFVSQGTLCRGSLGECDVAEACTGSAATCPADAAQPVNTPCGGAPNGVCDAQDVCTGSVGASAACTPVFMPASTVCRAANGSCDVAESCTGNAVDCPTDGFVAAGTECRASGGQCDAAEACSGSSGACPADALVPSGTVCRASVGACDAAEACSGNAVDCPADAAQPEGTACGAPPNGACDAQDTCSGTVGATATCDPIFLASSVVCRSANGGCDVAESCTGSDVDCPADGFVAAGTECRASAGQCDTAEACTGNSGACPRDVLVASGTPCRPSIGACDAGEACTGNAVDCPADAAQPEGTFCGGAPSGACDAQDICAGLVGATATCSPQFLPSSTICRPAGGSCDVAESCTGSTTTCPNDVLVASGTVCRDSVGPCDVAERCDGVAATCAADAARPAGTPCGGAPNGACDAQDTCSGDVGATATCSANYQPSSTVCRPSAGSCDIAENCTGSTTTCPANGFVAAGTTCRASVGECDAAETCSGNAASCAPDAARPAGTACGGSPNGDCDAQDTCSGSTGATATCVARFQPSSTTCRPTAGDCDVAESCTGSTTTCPSDAFLAAGSVCRATSGVCDVEEACTGAGAACPPNTFVAAGTVCRASAGSCDVEEACSGNAGACPSDAAVTPGTPCGGAPSGDCDAQDTCSGTTGASATCVARFASADTVCRAAAGPCDAAESCTGDATACPADGFLAAGSSCSDGSACTDSDECNGSGSCTPGGAVRCDDDNPCTADACDATRGCVTTPVADGTACSDDSACTVNDSCRAGVCRSGAALDCDDDNDCTADVCGPSTGCRHVSRNGELCADGNGLCVGTTCELEPSGEGGAGATPATGGSSGSAGSVASGGASGSSAIGGASGASGTATEEGGAAGETGSAGEGGEGAVRPPRPPVTTRTGCHCRVGDQGDEGGPAWLGLLAIAALVLRRRGASLRAD